VYSQRQKSQPCRPRQKKGPFTRCGRRESERDEHTEYDRHDLELGNRIRFDRFHTDVMIQTIDAAEVVLLHPDDIVDVNPHTETFRVLRRHQAYAPERQRVGGGQQERGRESEVPRGLRHFFSDLFDFSDFSFSDFVGAGPFDSVPVSATVLPGAETRT
jgi:hypothetical protein